jgi:ABC-2 type transport system permease protein
MLGIRAEFKLATTLCSLISSFTLIAISIGLGSCFPNFRQDNPSRIIAGFGGTLSLIISLLYVALMLFLLGLPFQLNLLGKIADSELRFYLGISILTLSLISALLIYVHLYAGKRRLELFEF